MQQITIAILSSWGERVFKFLWLFLATTTIPAMLCTSVFLIISHVSKKKLELRNWEFFIIISLAVFLIYEILLLASAQELKSQLAHLINFTLALSSGLIALALRIIITKHFLSPS